MKPEDLKVSLPCVNNEESARPNIEDLRPLAKRGPLALTSYPAALVCSKDHPRYSPDVSIVNDSIF